MRRVRTEKDSRMDGGSQQIEFSPCYDDAVLFHNSWWLDAAVGSACECVAIDLNGHTAGRLFFHRSTRFGMTRLRMPPYTRTLAPVLDPPASKPAQALANKRRIVQALFDALPSFDLLEFALGPEDPADVGFACEQAGAAVTQTFTFRTPQSGQTAELWLGLDQKTRNVIRSAGLKCTGPSTGTFDRFADMFRREHGEAIRANLASLRRLYEAASARGQCCIRIAGVGDTDAAGTMLVWDNRVMYLLATTRAPVAPGGANALLVWDAMQIAMNQGRILDLDGYNSPSSARFLATFGLVPLPRAVISKRSLRYAAAEWANARIVRSRGSVRV